MLASAIPTKVPVPFADAGARNTIPAASQIGITPGLASLIDGFPPLTLTPLAAGGIPPRGQDMNGILWLTSAWSRWSGAGGPIYYDSAFSTAIGGYPKGAVLSAATLGSWWLSLVDNNTSNPDTGGANWLGYRAGGMYMQVFAATGTFVIPAGGNRLKARLVGGGGGGGGGNASFAAAGGGAGGYSEGVFTVTPGASLAATVGTGGSGGGNGGNGGTTSLGSLLSATGGGGGAGSGAGTAAGGGGGSGTGGSVNIPGGWGNDGNAASGAGSGGAGGASTFGGGGRSGSGAGLAGAAPGSGGGGCYGAAGFGGAGAAGIIIVEW